MTDIEKLIAELEARAKSDNSTKFLDYDRRKMLEAAAALRSQAYELVQWKNKHAHKSVAFDYLYWSLYNLLVYPNSSPDTSFEEKVEEAEKLLKNGLFHDEANNDCGYAETHVLVSLDEIVEKDVTVASLRAQLAACEEAKARACLAFEIYASFGGYHPNMGNGSNYYVETRGTEVENEGWSDRRTYPVGEKFDNLTIDSVIKTAFIVIGKGGTFGTRFDQRLAALKEKA